jgi:hypothetical protein
LTTRARELLGDDLPLIDDGVTVEHLLTHRSGIGDYLDENEAYQVDDYVLAVPVHTLAKTIDYLTVLDGHPQCFRPDERFAYNNGGFVVLALLAVNALARSAAPRVVRGQQNSPQRRWRLVSVSIAVEAGGSTGARQNSHSSGGRGSYGRRMANRYQYTVVELREGMIGGKMSGGKLQQVLNEHAAQGWQLKAITSVEVKGRVGPGGVEGLLVTFERPVG